MGKKIRLRGMLRVIQLREDERPSESNDERMAASNQMDRDALFASMPTDDYSHLAELASLKLEDGNRSVHVIVYETDEYLARLTIDGEKVIELSGITLADAIDDFADLCRRVGFDL